MKLTVALTAVVAAAALTATTYAHAARPHVTHVKQVRWYHLSLSQKRQVVVEAIGKERQPLRWWIHTRARLPDSASGPLVFCAFVGVRVPPAICRTTVPLVRSLHVLYRIEARLAAAARARLLASRPAHYALWMCIHGDPAYRHDGVGEGAWGAVSPNGLYHNGLQMSWGWGELNGDPNNYSPMQVIWAAEHGYAASGYSRTWLGHQWPHTSPGCMGYA